MKICKSVIAIMSIIAICISALFFCCSGIDVAAAEVDDGLGKEGGGSFDLSFSYVNDMTASGSNVTLPLENVVTQYGTYTGTATYFYNWLDSKKLFSTEKDIYAYKVVMYRTSFGAGNWVNIDQLKLAVGTRNDLSAGTAQINRGVSADHDSVYWLVTEYQDGLDYYAALFSKAHEYVSAYDNGTQSVTYPHLNVSAGYSVLYAKYSYDDYVAAIYNDLQDILASLEQGNDLSETQVEYLNTLIGLVEDLNEEADVQTGLLKELNALLTKYLKLLDDKNAQQISLLEQILAILEASGAESTDPLPDDPVNDALEQEDELIQDTTDAEEELQFDIDTDSNNIVWNIIERMLNANPKVFASFVGIMTLGIVALLLNR